MRFSSRHQPRECSFQSAAASGKTLQPNRWPQDSSASVPALRAIPDKTSIDAGRMSVHIAASPAVVRRFSRFFRIVSRAQVSA